MIRSAAERSVIAGVKNVLLLNQTINASLNQLVTITRNLLLRLPQGQLFVTVNVGSNEALIVRCITCFGF